MLRLLFSAFGMHAHRSPRIHCDGVELAGSADTDTLVFFAMHFPRNASLDPTDVALLQWYSREVHRANAAMYVLLYHQPIPGGPDVPHKRMQNLSVSVNAGVCAWRKEQVFERLPRLKFALAQSEGYQRETDPHIAMYYYMHASLFLWNESIGAKVYKNAKYWWRIEPDVVFSGGLSKLLDVTKRDPADLILHKFLVPQRDFDRETGEMDKAMRWHWDPNQLLLQYVPPARRVRSLVSIGRYSTRFLRLYGARFWVRGIAAYEEIGLPVACTNESLSIVTTAGALTHPPRLPGGCDMAAFSAGAGVRNLKLAPHFQYRPAIACAEYADALRRGTNELWHPVKDRSCLPAIVSGL